MTGIYRLQHQSALMATQHHGAHANCHWKCYKRGHSSPLLYRNIEALELTATTHGKTPKNETLLFTWSYLICMFLSGHLHPLCWWFWLFAYRTDIVSLVIVLGKKPSWKTEDEWGLKLNHTHKTRIRSNIFIQYCFYLVLLLYIYSDGCCLGNHRFYVREQIRNSKECLCHI